MVVKRLPTKNLPTRQRTRYTFYIQSFTLTFIQINTLISINCCKSLPFNQTKEEIHQKPTHKEINMCDDVAEFSRHVETVDYDLEGLFDKKSSD